MSSQNNIERVNGLNDKKKRYSCMSSQNNIERVNGLNDKKKGIVV